MLNAEGRVLSEKKSMANYRGTMDQQQKQHQQQHRQQQQHRFQWVSPPAGAAALVTLQSLCHSEARLRKRGFPFLDDSSGINNNSFGGIGNSSTNNNNNNNSNNNSSGNGRAKGGDGRGRGKGSGQGRGGQGRGGQDRGGQNRGGQNRGRDMENRALFQPTPPPHPARGLRRAAVVIDCEMVQLADGRKDLVKLCAVDFVTGEILIDALVQPTGRIANFLTRYTGVTSIMLNEARRRGRALAGWPAARARLFEFVDSDTVLVGHALDNDLKALYVSHARVADTALMTADAVFGDHDNTSSRTGSGGGGGVSETRSPRTWALNKLAAQLLGVRIQRPTHDCLEDVLATREVALRCCCAPTPLAPAALPPTFASTTAPTGTGAGAGPTSPSSRGTDLARWAATARREHDVAERARAEKREKERAEKREKERLEREEAAKLDAAELNGAVLRTGMARVVVIDDGEEDLTDLDATEPPRTGMASPVMFYSLGGRLELR
ncbi:ribonuclease H-like domain-containing protein [Xylariaceae sp. FL0804]|nr:ribonuclease H-like domain-containing protein [Xylariaceae sp. FL0804]